MKVDLFNAINRADIVVCGGYEIDGFDFSKAGVVRLECGDDEIAVLKDQQVSIDEFGDCRVSDGDGCEVHLSFKVHAAMRATDLAESATLPEALIDQHLDRILRGAGSALRHYSLPKSLDDMRAALRQAVSALAPR